MASAALASRETTSADARGEVGGPIVRQYVVVDRSLGMSAGKLAAQVAHASVAALLAGTQRYVEQGDAGAAPIGLEWGGSLARTSIDADVLAAWVRQGEPKIVLAVDGERALASLVNRAESRGLMEGMDFFCIRDACRTELTPDVSGSRWTCVGFAPMDMETIAPVTGQLPLYRWDWFLGVGLPAGGALAPPRPFVFCESAKTSRGSCVETRADGRKGIMCAMVRGLRLCLWLSSS